MTLFETQGHVLSLVILRQRDVASCDRTHRIRAITGHIETTWRCLLVTERTHAVTGHIATP